MRQEAVSAALSNTHRNNASGEVSEYVLEQLKGEVWRKRLYRVYVPHDYSANKCYSLIVVLHGCRQDHLAMQQICGFDAIADRVGAIVVYPFITSYSGLRTENCWGWWMERQRQRGRGEVADIQTIAEEVSDKFAVDKSRRHICGLSAGGAMTVASLASYSDFWTSGASVAGVPFGETARAVRTSSHLPVRRKTVNTLVRMLDRELVTAAPPLLVVQSQADAMVGPKLGANLRDTWRQVTDTNTLPYMVYSDITRGIGWRLEQYGTPTDLQVGHLQLQKLGHGWPGGVPGKYCYPEAPNISELIVMFFAHTAAQREHSSPG